MNKAPQPRPARDGELWTGFEELELERGFEEGYSLIDLAEMHQRTKKAITGRLVRLGKIYYDQPRHAFYKIGPEWAKQKDLKA